MNKKSSLKEIEARFDKDVDRFSNLETGQATTVDALFNLELITDGIAHSHPQLTELLDIGCGAGNYTVKLLSKLQSNPNVILSDLSKPMLEKATDRIKSLTKGKVNQVQGDFRSMDLQGKTVDCIIATAVLHHLRDDADWESSFRKLFGLLKPGGSLWIFDLVAHDEQSIHHLMYEQRYGDFLISLRDKAYRDHVFDYIDHEDSPRSTLYQVDMLRKVGFDRVEILHKHLCFASFVAYKGDLN